MASPDEISADARSRSRRWAAGPVATLIVLFARAVTAVRAHWSPDGPPQRQHVYYANHSSHGDFILVWTVFPSALRATARPVAARDYWNAGATRRFLAHNVFDAVLIDRESTTRSVDPIGQMASALEAGSSLILFPEGTRNMGEEPLLPLRTLPAGGFGSGSGRDARTSRATRTMRAISRAGSRNRSVLQTRRWTHPRRPSCSGRSRARSRVLRIAA